jgi:hypothetical protein
VAGLAWVGCAGCLSTGERKLGLALGPNGVEWTDSCEAADGQCASTVDLDFLGFLERFRKAKEEAVVLAVETAAVAEAVEKPPDPVNAADVGMTDGLRDALVDQLKDPELSDERKAGIIDLLFGDMLRRPPAPLEPEALGGP